MESTLYWIFRLDNIRYTCMLLIVLSLLAIVIITATCAIEYNESNNRWWMKIYKISFIVLGFTILGICFIPTTKEMLVIKGFKTMYNYIESNDEIKMIHDKTLKSIDKYLDEYLNE